MKKIISLTLAVLLGCTCLLASAEVDKSLSGTSITVYNWGQYISDGSDGTINVIKEFEKATGISVNYLTYEDNESLYSKLKTGGASYDVIFPSDYMAQKLIEENMLEELDFNNIANYSLIPDTFKNPAYDNENKYTVPYTWGTVGVIYNTKYVTEKVDSWDILWNEKYKGKILMFGNSRDAFSIAQFMLGHSVNTENEEELNAAADKLKEQKPLVAAYVMDQIFDKMYNEDAWIAPYYAGDFVTMNQKNPNLAFCFPKEGFNRFVDVAAIPKGAKNKKGAEMFIDFITNPEISGQNCDVIGYTSPVEGSKEFLSEEIANSDIVYPGDEILLRAESFNSLSAQTYQLMEKLFTQVKASGNSTWIIFLIIGAVLILVVVFVLIRSKKKNKY